MEFHRLAGGNGKQAQLKASLPRMARVLGIVALHMTEFPFLTCPT